MGPCLLIFRRQVMVRGVRANDTATEHDIAKDTMNADRIPQGGMDDVPDVAEEPALLVDPARSLHEGGPRVGKVHQNRTDQVEQNRDAAVDPFQEPTVIHLVPAVVVNIKNATLRQEHQRINMHDRTENRCHVFEETRE